MTGCPSHPNAPLTRETSRYGDLWVCSVATCNYAVSAQRMEAVSVPALPSSVNADAPHSITGQNGRTGTSDATERLLVARIIAKLEAEGYQVLRVGQLRAKGSGTDEGYPDLSVRHPSWYRGICVLMEVKTATGRVRKRQQELSDEGWSHIVRSDIEALDAARQVAEVVGGRDEG